MNTLYVSTVDTFICVTHETIVVFSLITWQSRLSDFELKVTVLGEEGKVHVPRRPRCLPIGIMRVKITLSFITRWALGHL